MRYVKVTFVSTYDKVAGFILLYFALLYGLWLISAKILSLPGFEEYGLTLLAITHIPLTYLLAYAVNKSDNRNIKQLTLIPRIMLSVISFGLVWFFLFALLAGLLMADAAK
ncbi:hypothetical protein QNI16_32875 [Cytophagaceae bacterium YF14B1]|uniref:Uncharacterized protein n=1 Tax=Xanthocytophaga flava TaxID=3048013 RepID=A0AAE3QTT0_9BACT|nr:hypothetical protein [Xanthocytophaga flavus]MDJ1485332.1 hypothetical protein [Xanthocytophaga flavus]